MRADIAATLAAAADLIERDGWARGTAHRNGSHCVVGALALVTGYHEVYGRLGDVALYRHDEAKEQVLDEACREFADWLSGSADPVNIPMWNDQAHRTGEEVVKTLRAAAAESLP